MRILEFGYLDDNQEFFDYETGTIEGSNCFDTSKTGMSFYDDFITDSEYMRNKKNLKCDLVQMTPNEYFEGCADIFNSSAEQQKTQTGRDVNTISKLKTVLTKYKKQFPVTFLNYAQKQQEGRHRMYVAGELFGWDTKHPVMVINWADEEKARQDQNREKQKELDMKVRTGVLDALSYKYKDIEDFKGQLQWSLNRSFNGYDDDASDIKFDIIQNNDEYVVSANGGSYSFYQDNIKYKTEEDEESFTDDDIDAWLADYLSDTWDTKTEEEKDKLRDKIRNTL